MGKAADRRRWWRFNFECLRGREKGPHLRPPTDARLDNRCSHARWCAELERSKQTEESTDGT